MSCPPKIFPRFSNKIVVYRLTAKEKNVHAVTKKIWPLRIQNG